MLHAQSCGPTDIFQAFCWNFTIAKRPDWLSEILPKSINRRFEVLFLFLPCLLLLSMVVYRFFEGPMAKWLSARGGPFMNDATFQAQTPRGRFLRTLGAWLLASLVMTYLKANWFT